MTPVKDREGAPMNITFTYTFTYDQVSACTLQYPLMVHGQFLDAKWYSRPNASGTMVNPMRRNRAPAMTQASSGIVRCRSSARRQATTGATMT